MIQQNVRQSTPPPSWVPGAIECRNEPNIHLSYLDDVAWVVETRSAGELAKQMSECAEWTIEWGKAAGVVFEENKTEVLVLTGGKTVKKTDLGHTHVIIGGNQIPFQMLPIRWLGFILDSKLKFDEHHKV